MNRRWKMNRIGFLNFWLYDEENFYFEDGKLLLRGQNGSGKSITTQSFIPFILDGDRTPSRLDPFGSSDRRMEYYFLGEEGKDEATGYLFLEFKKDESEEYRTIAIGQRARRGKSMDFWGFVLMDGRRIGIDFTLYKETGSTRIPLNKQDVKKLLGEEVPFTDVPGEYKAMVNKYLFGFRRPEQYEQYIKLLVKVRAPKLSKEFKPTKVYEILNESLQTLTDEDLRAMVDAMEKMDTIQENLDQLRRAFSDVKAIRNEYQHYNQYMLAQKGQAFLDINAQATKKQKEFDQQEQLKKDLIEENAEQQTCKEQYEDQLQLIETQLTSLIDSDMEQADRKLMQAQRDKADALTQGKKWQERMDASDACLVELDTKSRHAKQERELQEKDFCGERSTLEELQETLQWTEHNEVKKLMALVQTEGTAQITSQIRDYQKEISRGKSSILQYDLVNKELDRVTEAFELAKTKKISKEQEQNQAQDQVLSCQDHLIESCYELPRNNQEWKPSQECLAAVEQIIKKYQHTSDAGDIMSTFRLSYEKSRQDLQDQLADVIRDWNNYETNFLTVTKELADLKGKAELEPLRDSQVLESREMLAKAGIQAIPFYKTVEFDENLSQEEEDRLEWQLRMMGILDALIVPVSCISKVQQDFPQLMDTVLTVKTLGNSSFDKLTVNGTLSAEMKEAVSYVLSWIQEKPDPQHSADSTLYIGDNGDFQQGILYGRAREISPAEFVGTLARQRKKEQKLKDLQEQIHFLRQQMDTLQSTKEQLQVRIQLLSSEYKDCIDFQPMDQALELVERCEIALKHLDEQYLEQERVLNKTQEQCHQLLQKVIKECKNLPYGRTITEYEEAEQTAEEYLHTWQEIREILMKLENLTSDLSGIDSAREREEEERENSFQEKRRCTLLSEKFQIDISRYEEYLNREETKEKAKQVELLRNEEKRLSSSLKQAEQKITEIKTRLKIMAETEHNRRLSLEEDIVKENQLGLFFQEELSLGLVIQQETKSLASCANLAVDLLRDSDRLKEPQEVLNSLYRVYQQHNSSLASYGTTMEDCFDNQDEDIGALRKRVRIASVWNGKKLYLEEFFHVLKTQIEETELLIQEKDRELFEDILSRTISQQLTDRIAESRKWVQDMSKLMRSMDTSMGLTFSLSWKPQTAENDAELDTSELEHILLRDKELLTVEDISRVAAHFRSKIKTEKLKLTEDGMALNYMDLVRDALDYRKWFSFQMFYQRNEEEKKPLTNAAFNRFSGGEKAMAMYVPLFAAVNAQYHKASKEDHPRIVALDEAFAGVDDKNISSMFQLVESLDFDYIMNSQALWGCFDTVKKLKIAELLRPLNSQMVTVISYLWNGHERILDE